MTESHPPFTMGEYAAVLAHLAHYPVAHRADVLARLDVSEAEWTEADKRLPAAMIQGLLDEDPSLGDVFNDAFVPVKGRLKSEKPEIASLPPLRPPLAPATPLVASAGPAALPALEPAPPGLAPPEPVFTPPAPVFTPPEPAFAPPAFIFAPPEPVAPPVDRAALVPVGMRHFKSLKGTEAAVSATPAPAPALPFRAAIAGEAAAIAKPDPSSLVPEGMRGFKSLSGTHGVTLPSKGPALPFAGVKEPPPAPPPPVVVSPPLDLPPFSVEQYASLCVELELDPARTAETLLRYRLTPSLRAALDASWRERMAQASDLYAAWSQAVTRYKTWKLQQPPR